MGDECNCPVAWTFFTTTFHRTWDEDWPFLVLWSLMSFPILLTYWVQHFNRIILFVCFRILNSSAGIPLPPLALLAAELPKAYLTSHSRMSGSEWETIPSWLSGSLRSFCFCTVLLCILPISSWSLLLLLGLYCFYPLLCPSLDEMFLWYFQFSWKDLSYPFCSYLLFLCIVHWRRHSCLSLLFSGICI